MDSGIKALAIAITAVLPAFITVPSKSRRARNFRVDKIREMLGDERKPAIDAWLVVLRRLMRMRVPLGLSVNKLSALVGPCAENPEALMDADAIKAGFADVIAAHDLFAVVLKEYDALEKAVNVALKTVVDAESKTAGWQELIDLARDQASLRTALIDRSAREQLAEEVKQALKQIDTGNGKVLSKKFEELSGAVQKWWDLLRPDELSFFSGAPASGRTADDRLQGGSVGKCRPQQSSTPRRYRSVRYVPASLPRAFALDPSHPGKLRTIGAAVNLATHDDAVPAAGVLKVALGDLRFLKKSYL